MPIALSFSRMKSIPCPHAFNAKYIAKTHQEQETEPMLVGREFANVVRDYRKHCYRAGLSSDLGFFGQVKLEYPRTGELIQWFSKSEFAVVPLDATQVMIERQMAYNQHMQLIAPQNGQTERDAWFSKDAAFRLIPDFAYRIGDTLHIIDDKTGRGENDELQLRIMAAMIYRAIPAMDASGLMRVRARFNCVALQESPPALEFGLGEDIAGVVDSIKEKIALVNSWTEFPAVRCELCGNCTVPDCPIRAQAEHAIVEAARKDLPALKMPTEITSKEDAELSLLFRLFLVDIEKRIDKLQRDWVKDHGPIEAGGKVLGFDTTTSWKPVNLEQLMQVMMSYGVTRQQILNNISFTKTAIEKTMKQAKKQDRVQMLMPLIEVKETEKFSIKSAKGDPTDY